MNNSQSKFSRDKSKSSNSSGLSSSCCCGKASVSKEDSNKESENK